VYGTLLSLPRTRSFLARNGSQQSRGHQEERGRKWGCGQGKEEGGRGRKKGGTCSALETAGRSQICSLFRKESCQKELLTAVRGPPTQTTTGRREKAHASNFFSVVAFLRRLPVCDLCTFFHSGLAVKAGRGDERFSLPEQTAMWCLRYQARREADVIWRNRLLAYPFDLSDFWYNLRKGRNPCAVAVARAKHCRRRNS
jgi:hypothetical protein